MMLYLPAGRQVWDVRCFCIGDLAYKKGAKTKAIFIS